MDNWDSGSPRPTEEVIDAVLTASRVLVAVAARSLADTGEDVTITQYRTLVVLASRGPQSLTSLAELVGVTPATATRMCDRLVRTHLIARREQEVDRRQLRVELTKKGSLLVSAVTEHRRREIERIISEIPASERAVLVQALRRFGAAAEEVPEQHWTAGWDL